MARVVATTGDGDDNDNDDDNDAGIGADLVRTPVRGGVREEKEV